MFNLEKNTRKGVGEFNPPKNGKARKVDLSDQMIGYGAVIASHVDTKLFWPNESTQCESRYPLSIKFKPIHVADNWHKKKMGLYGTGIEYFSGLNYVEPDKRKKLLRKLDAIYTILSESKIHTSGG